MTIRQFNLDVVDPSWQPSFSEALQQVEPDYLENLYKNPNWLPGPNNIFNAFSLPLDKVNYVLFGESPYPRMESANGYAFWDNAVSSLWSNCGLDKKVNRATSLRNFIKMLLVADGKLAPNQTTQDFIAQLDKTHYIQTNAELFNNLLKHGFLLLNATLVLQPDSSVRKDALAWHPFIKHILTFLFEKKPHVQLVLFGNIANTIDKLVDHFEIKRVYAEHPYNISFINNPKVIDFFKPLHLLSP